MDIACRYIVVGAGFYGAVMAERIANVLGEKVLVLEQRAHIGGNSYSETHIPTGIEVHKYGSHIFHTPNKKVWDYINRFSGFNQYRHKVWSSYQSELYSMPVNLLTLKKFFKKDLDEESAKCFLLSLQKSTSEDSFEAKALSSIGSELYEAFFRGYTKKQWNTDPRLLPSSTFSRLPVRYNSNTDYFDDPYQGIPLEGYSNIFKKMLSHPLIEVRLGVDFFAVKDQIPKDSLVIYSGPIDRYFKYTEGVLGWRTLDFQEEIIERGDFQGTTVVNYPEEKIPYTRIHEFRHYHPERNYRNDRSVIYKEYSRTALEKDTPYYPINTALDQEMYKKYEKLSLNEKNVIFGGRLGSYKYFDMHHVIAMALKTFEERFGKI
ncbi:MAG: UDP-galactopyranose mutase [Bacteriovoracaceae bacterium]